MMSSIFNLHTFLIANAAMAVSYLLAKNLLRIRLFKTKLSQVQQLRFARHCFIFTITTFLLTPSIIAITPFHHVNIEIEPMLMHASTSFLRHHENVAAQVATVYAMPGYINLSNLFILMWSVGFCIYLFKYVRMLQTLRDLRDNSYCLRAIGSVNILFSKSVTSPFCWSFLQRHYIALPESFTTQQQHCKLAIQHEIQHIRQGDTYWLHTMNIINLFCYWNPFLKSWLNWLSERQEFACDETIILRRNASPTAYAQCLLDTASTQLLATGVIGMSGKTKSSLYRRVNMIFNYRKKGAKLALLAAYSVGFLAITSAAYAVNNSSAALLSASDVRALIKYSHLKTALQVTAAPEVVAYLNEIRNNPEKKQKIVAALGRMKNYQSNIQQALRRQNMPDDLLALPLIESGYQPLAENLNAVKAAGIWQIIPSTANDLGLVVNDKRDDRMNMSLATNAALALLNSAHDEFHDWKLAVMSYEIGDKETTHLIAATGSRDAWVIARSDVVPKKYKNELIKYLAMFDASVILIHNPSVITG